MKKENKVFGRIMIALWVLSVLSMIDLTLNPIHKFKYHSFRFKSVYIESTPLFNYKNCYKIIPKEKIMKTWVEDGTPVSITNYYSIKHLEFNSLILNSIDVSKREDTFIRRSINDQYWLITNNTLPLRYIFTFEK
jgi:hypothetical protein